MINLEYIDIEQACNVLESTVTQGRCFHFDKKYQAAMDDLTCASRINAHLALKPGTSNLELNVLCKEDVV